MGVIKIFRLVLICSYSKRIFTILRCAATVLSKCVSSEFLVECKNSYK